MEALAIAAFVLSLIAFVPVAVPLGIVALVRIRRTGARGKVLAILSLVISALWLLIGALIVAAVVALLPDRDATTGQVTERQSLSVGDLRVNDCLTDKPTGDSARRMEVTPCANPHWAEVFATFSLPGGAFPGDSTVVEQADAGCRDRTPDVAESRRAGLTLSFIYPRSRNWERDDRRVTCLIVSESAPLSGRLLQQPLTPVSP